MAPTTRSPLPPSPASHTRQKRGEGGLVAASILAVLTAGAALLMTLVIGMSTDPCSGSASGCGEYNLLALGLDLGAGVFGVVAVALAWGTTNPRARRGWTLASLAAPALVWGALALATWDVNRF